MSNKFIAALIVLAIVQACKTKPIPPEPDYAKATGCSDIIDHEGRLIVKCSPLKALKKKTATLSATESLQDGGAK